MKVIEKSKLSDIDYKAILKRPAIKGEKVADIVKPILADIKENGTKAALKYADKLDGLNSEMRVTDAEFAEAEREIDPELKEAIEVAVKNIEKFHKEQIPSSYSVETSEGVICKKIFKPIENVGLYIPGGSAVLPSTMMMLGIPSKLAKCGRVIACTPVKEKVHPAILFAAKLCGITEIYKIGGAQAIGLMAYGSEDIKKVDKIFGPGNQFVTTAKTLVSIDPEGCSIDMPAGPSEVLVIADGKANAEFVAADLLSQAEHGPDSQAIVVTNSKELAEKTMVAVERQLEVLPRKETAQKALENSFALVVDSLEEAMDYSNEYAPEHLIINVENPDALVEKVSNAGSVFVGAYTPESAGDYASGTNHSLPTYGYAKSFGGVCVEMFMKGITVQTISKDGLNKLGKTIVTLAEAEELQAHANAVKIRIA